MKKVLSLLAVIFSFTAIAQPTPDYSKLSQHPRLILKEGDIELVRQKIERDRPLRKMHSIIKGRADKHLDLAVSERKKTGKRLLSVSRNVLERVCYCSYMYLVSSDESYARRAEKEMLAAASFTDWNPSHFLDVAEMMAALAIGYDWLYDWLSPESKKIIEDAIIEKGLRTATDDIKWLREKNINRTQVCNAGVIMGALAVYERIPKEAKRHIEESIKRNALALGLYAPDGIYPEGYGYWIYGNWYEVMLIESLRTALGTSFEIEKTPGFLQTGLFANFMTSPIGRTFNFYDCDNQYNEINPLLYWFALETGDISLVWQDRKRLVEEENIRGINPQSPLAMIFASRCNFKDAQPISQKSWAGQGINPIYFYRSGWDKKTDGYLAAKGGSPLSSHAHMDGGSFIYEWGGVRWARDLGMQGYHSLESKGIKLGARTERWSVYRLNNYSHNTLTINEKLHRFDQMATMTKVIDKDNCHGAEFDLTQLFPDMRKVCRKIYIDNSNRVTCIDKLENGEGESNIRWNMCTFAKAEIIDDKNILLRENGQEVILRVISPANARAYIMSNNTDTFYDAKNDGVRVGFTLSVAPNAKCTLKVELRPNN